MLCTSASPSHWSHRYAETKHWNLQLETECKKLMFRHSQYCSSERNESMPYKCQPWRVFWHCLCRKTSACFWLQTSALPSFSFLSPPVSIIRTCKTQVKNLCLSIKRLSRSPLFIFMELSKFNVDIWYDKKLHTNCLLCSVWSKVNVSSTRAPNTAVLL